MSVATSTPVAPLGARNGAANLAARTLGASAGRNDAVSLRTTLAREGSSTTEATVADTQNATTGQRNRTTVRSIVESTCGTLRFASRGGGAGEAGSRAVRKEFEIRKQMAGAVWRPQQYDSIVHTPGGIGRLTVVVLGTFVALVPAAIERGVRTGACCRYACPS